MGEFCQLVELHQEGSALAACAAGLFSVVQSSVVVSEWPVFFFPSNAAKKIAHEELKKTRVALHV